LRQFRRRFEHFLSDKSGDNPGLVGTRNLRDLPMSSSTLPPATDWPLYWFAKLEKAVEEGDHQAAAEAQRQLARLGVRVAYGRPGSPREEVTIAS
jgi:hypothetical protein